MTTAVDRFFGRIFHRTAQAPKRPPSWLARVTVPGVSQPFDVVFYRDEGGWYVGEVPELPGCVSQGETLDAFMGNIAEAIEGCRLTRLAEGMPDRVELGAPVPVLA